MRPLLRRFFSLTLSAIFSFSLPLLLIGSLVMAFAGLRIVAPLAPLSQQALHHLLSFLATLGSGSPWQGLLVVGLASSIVGVLFDTFASNRFEGFSHR